jgi:multidrug transporter EmrE-like cation transporter
LILRVWTDNTNVWKWYVFGILIYFISLNLLAQSYRFKNIAIASLIMEIVNLATYLGVSYWKFGDVLSKMEITGVILGIGAIICFEL